MQKKGKIVTLIGPNGSGKSTTAKIALGIYKNIEGSVEKYTNKVGYVPQKISIDWTLPLRVYDFMLLTENIKEEAIDVPEKYGGSEMTKTGMCILAEGISFCGSPSFCTVWNVQTSIGSLGIIWYGNDEQKQKWLPGICSGKKIAAFGLTEPEAGSDATNSKTTGVLSDDGKHYVLNGQKIFISNGAWADTFIVALKIDGKFSSIVVEKGTPGFEFGKEQKKEWSLHL